MINTKDIPHFKDLFPPEYYHEIQGFDSRLTVLKLNDVREILGDCAIAIIYSNNDEQKEIENEFTRNVIRRMYIRHAIIDLNNCFDLLLQVPWFFYRIWKTFNCKGTYYNSKDKRYCNYTNITRNKEFWVKNAEKCCNYYKVFKFLDRNTDTKLNELANDYNKFKNIFISNRGKPFTIRTVANSMKHNGALKFKEFKNPYNIKFKIGDKIFNSKNGKSSLKFFELKNKEKALGEINCEYSDDLYIDIKYYNGELFRGKDYMKKDEYYSLDELHAEAELYFDNLIDLFNKVYDNISPKLIDSPLLNKDKIELSTAESINLDKYLKK